MSINKFITNLDLSRQAEIYLGEVACFQGGSQFGVPFSAFSTGVDTSTITSIGIPFSESAIFSGDTGTTIFDVSNPSSPNYNALFSGYTATTWTNPNFSAYTTGLTLPITPFSSDTQTLGPFWTLTQSTIINGNLIGLAYSGFILTYSFDEVTQVSSGGTWSGITSAVQENFTAGTLDYKGDLLWLNIKGNANIDDRTTTRLLTVSEGAQPNYVLRSIDSSGNLEYSPLSAITSSGCTPVIYTQDIYPCNTADTISVHGDFTVNGNFYVSGVTTSSTTIIQTETILAEDNNIELNYGGNHTTAIGGGITVLSGVSNSDNSSLYTLPDGTWVAYPKLSASTVSACTSIYTSNIYGCSPLHIEPSGVNDVYMVENGGNVGIGVLSAATKLHVSGNTMFNSDIIYHYADDGVTTPPVAIPNFKGNAMFMNYDQSIGLSILNYSSSGTSGIQMANNNLTFGQIFTPGSDYIKTFPGPVGSYFYRDKTIFRSGPVGTSNGMVINPNGGDPSATLWWEIDGASNMILRGDGVGASGNGRLGLKLNPDGTEMPTSNLQIGGTGTTGTFKYRDGNQASGYVLTSDSDGNATWQISSSGGTFTGNTSASCITDLFVTNVHGCSPINIQPISSDDVYMVNGGGNVMLGGNNPQSRLHISGNTMFNSDYIYHYSDDGTTTPEIITSLFKGYLMYKSSTGNTGFYSENPDTSGNTGLLFTSNYGNDKYITITYGGDDYIRPAIAPVVGFDFYRNKAAIAVSTNSDGLVIDLDGSGNDGNLWFAQNANAPIRIYGGGSPSDLRLGIALNPDGTEIPTAKLQVGGTGTTGTFKYIDGNQGSGKVLTSDSNGNATWQIPSSGSTFTGNTSASCITDLYITNLHGCSPITVHNNIQNVTSSASSSYSFVNVFGNGCISSSSGTLIGGGDGNGIGITSPNSVIGGGLNNYIVSSSHSSILGGDGNGITGGTYNFGVIAGGKNNKLLDGYSFIGGGSSNIIDGKGWDSILGGYGNRIDDEGINNRWVNSVVGGGQNKVYQSQYSTIGGGQNNILSASTFSSILGGRNSILKSSTESSIVSGNQQKLYSSDYSTIGGGKLNKIYGNTMHFIGGGNGNVINTGATTGSSIVGGILNTVNHGNSHIIGSNITSVSANTTHVEKLNIGTLNGTSSVVGLGLDANGFVVSAATGGGTFTGNTSASCITDLWVSNIYGCSPVNVNNSLTANDNNTVEIDFISGKTDNTNTIDLNYGTYSDIRLFSKGAFARDRYLSLSDDYLTVGATVLANGTDQYLALFSDTSTLYGTKVRLNSSYGTFDLISEGLNLDSTSRVYGLKVNESFTSSLLLTSTSLENGLLNGEIITGKQHPTLPTGQMRTGLGIQMTGGSGSEFYTTFLSTPRSVTYNDASYSTIWNNVIAAGSDHSMYTGVTDSFIGGGSGNTINAGVKRSAIVAGQNITATNNDTLYTQNLDVRGDLTMCSGGTAYIPTISGCSPVTIQGHTVVNNQNTFGPMRPNYVSDLITSANTSGDTYSIIIPSGWVIEDVMVYQKTPDSAIVRTGIGTTGGVWNTGNTKVFNVNLGNPMTLIGPISGVEQRYNYFSSSDVLNVRFYDAGLTPTSITDGQYKVLIKYWDGSESGIFD